MIQILINCVCFGFVGYFMADMGYHLGSWEIWMVVVPMLVVQINSAIWGYKL